MMHRQRGIYATIKPIKLLTEELGGDVNWCTGEGADGERIVDKQNETMPLKKQNHVINTW